MDERMLSDRERKILRWLNKHRGGTPTSEMLKGIRGTRTSETLDAIKLLDNSGFVEATYGIGDEYPAYLQITAEGSRKLDETVWKRMHETAYSNPWAALAVIIAILSLIGGVYLSMGNAQLQKANADLSKPILVAPDLRVQSGAINDISFTVLNPARDTDYYYQGGNCTPQDNGIFSIPQVAPQTMPTPITAAQIIEVPRQNIQGIKIAAGSSITLSCNDNYVLPITKDAITKMTVCVNIYGVTDALCKDMQVTVLASR